jgi:hypothetical protein
MVASPAGERALPEKRCGKSAVASVASALAAQPVHAINLSPFPGFPGIEADKPGLSIGGV